MGADNCSGKWNGKNWKRKHFETNKYGQKLKREREWKNVEKDSANLHDIVYKLNFKEFIC